MAFSSFPNAGVTEELQTLYRRFGQGLENLAKVRDVEIGCTPREAIYCEDKMMLYRFKKKSRQKSDIPVLIVYALVNRPYMADLQEGRSLVQGLLAQGLDVYLVDWGYPDASDRYLTLDDYLNGYLDRCVETIKARLGRERVNLLGICQGGTFSVCYSALHPEKVSNLITTVAPIDFHTPDDLLSRLVRHIDVDLVVDTCGNLSGDSLNSVFLSLQPFRLTSQKYVHLVDIMDDEQKLANFMRMEKWIFDSPDLAGEAYREFTRQFYQQNLLVRGKVKIGDQEVDPHRITIPVLNVYALKDHLVPPASSKALEGLTGSADYSALEFPGGHIGLFVSGKARKLVSPTIGQWLRDRS